MERVFTLNKSYSIYLTKYKDGKVEILRSYKNLHHTKYKDLVTGERNCPIYLLYSNHILSKTSIIEVIITISYDKQL